MSRNMYRDAIDVQNASNPNGVVNSLHEFMAQIRAEPGYAAQGAVYITSHPVFILFVDKLNSMAGYPNFEAYHKAHTLCEEKANAEETTSHNV